jgi:hypothetical protein
MASRLRGAAPGLFMALLSGVLGVRGVIGARYFSSVSSISTESYEARLPT